MLFVFWLIVVLVANKTDLDQRRIVTTKEGQAFAQKNGMGYFEISAVSIVASQTKPHAVQLFGLH